MCLNLHSSKSTSAIRSSLRLAQIRSKQDNDGMNPPGHKKRKLNNNHAAEHQYTDYNAMGHPHKSSKDKTNSQQSTQSPEHSPNSQQSTKLTSNEVSPTQQESIAQSNEESMTQQSKFTDDFKFGADWETALAKYNVKVDSSLVADTDRTKSYLYTIFVCALLNICAKIANRFKGYDKNIMPPWLTKWLHDLIVDIMWLSIFIFLTIPYHFFFV